jgi:hypothetical protein
VASVVRTLTNDDNDTKGYTVTDPAPAATKEDGSQTSIVKVNLNSQPTADVTIKVSTSKPTEATADVTSLTFTTTNWMTAQTITLTGVEDGLHDGDTTYDLVLDIGTDATTLSSDYAGLDPPDKTLTSIDTTP